MRCNIFSLDVDKLISKGPEAAITTQIELKRYINKYTNELVYGLDLGYCAPWRYAIPGTPLEPKHFLVLNAYEENHTVEDYIISDDFRRFLKREDEGECEYPCGTEAFFYLPPSNPDMSLRFLNEQNLKASRELLSTGYITKDNVVPQPIVTKSGRTIHPHVSKPGILCVRFMEIYQFQYWNCKEQALHIVSFSFYPRDGLVIIDDDIKFKRGSNTHYQPKSIETLRKLLSKKLEHNLAQINLKRMGSIDNIVDTIGRIASIFS